MKMMRCALFLFALFSLGRYVVAGEKEYVEREYFLYSAPTAQFIDAIDSSLTSARVRLAEILNDTLTYKPKIYIRDNIRAFKKLIGSAFPDWGAAAALPYRGMIALKSPAHFRLGKSLRELVQHEYSHLVLQHRLHHARAPRWLDEGVAMYIAAEWGWGDNLAMSRAVVFNSLIPLREIENMNRFPQARAQSAYAESYLAVRYLLDEYGIESFNILLDNLRNRKSIDTAFMAAVGGDFNGFEKEFFDYLEARYNLMSLFGDLYFLWIFLAAVVVIGFVLKYRKKRQYYKKWDEEEKYQSTDFDYGDPENPEQIEDEDTPWL